MVTPPRETEEGEVYHVLKRGIDKRDIFKEKRDYLRFLYYLFSFNDTGGTKKTPANVTQSADALREYQKKREKENERAIVAEVLSFALMPNHVHLLLRERTPGGIIRFMQRVGTAYAKYFNVKYERTGPLFEGRYRMVHVTRQAHFEYLPYYIHLNPLDLHMPEWRQHKLTDPDAALAWIDEYSWSSHKDYAGEEHFPLVTQRDFLYDVFGGPEGYRSGLRGWLRTFDNATMQSVYLE